MTFGPGARLGHYELVEPLGEGGMGEVWRARDLALGREVAIKRMGAALAGDPAHLARFEREARLLAVLDDPHVARIFDVGRAGDVPYLVLELVPGPTLAERIAGRPLDLETALGIARQVVRGLAAAHRAGIVHRDLKPANVKLRPDGVVKLLDFGIAKFTPSGAATAASEVTLTAATLPGAVFGTPSAMSPEQLRGAASVDHRTDVWSFGCLLFEMLTARRAFEAPTLAEVIGRVLTSGPDLAALPGDVPRAVRAVIARCLAKDPADRFASADELGAALERAARRAAPVVTLKQLTTDDAIAQFPAVSPDGRTLAYAAERGRVRKIVVRPLAGGEPGLLTDGPHVLTDGPHDDLLPAWSADGAALLFVRARTPGVTLEPGDVFGEYSDADVWEVDLATRRARKLVADAFHPAPSPDGRTLAVDARWAGPHRIWLVDRNGRNPRQLSDDRSEGVLHLRPRWSPDGRRLVYQVVERTKFALGLVDVATRTQRRLAPGPYLDYQPAWSAGGDAVLFASYRSGGLNLWDVPVDDDGAPAGAPRQVTTGAGQDVEPVALPGGRVVFTTLRQNASLWRLPVDPATGRPAGPPEKVVASSREDSRGAWSPDGTRIAFNSDRGGDMNIWLREADGTLRPLTTGPGGDFQPNWSPDQRTLAFFSSRDGLPALWTVDVASGALARLTAPGAGFIDINPFWSPDGRHIAYQSDADGRLEIWVMEADGSAPRQLSRIGSRGHFMRWTDDGGHVLFSSPSDVNALFRVALDGGEAEPVAPLAGGAHLSLAPDRRLLLDVVGHKTLWISPLDGRGAPHAVFEFDDPDVRIDYPLWSPDGRFVLFDRFKPRGGDIWMLEGWE